MAEWKRMSTPLKKSYEILKNNISEGKYIPKIEGCKSGMALPRAGSHVD